MGRKSAVSPVITDAGLPNGASVKSLSGSVHSGSGTLVEDDDGAVGLKQGVGLIGGISFIVGSIIGSGIFVSPKGVLAGSGSVGLSLIVWAIGGMVVMIGAMSYVELGTMITQSGGEYAYLRTAYHRLLGFLYSFMQTLLLRPAIAAIISLTCGEYLTTLFFQDDCGSPPATIVKLIGITVLLCVAAVNVWSVEVATKIQVVFTGAKLLALAIIIITGFVLLGQGNTDYLSNGFDWIDGPASLGSVALGFYSSMWAYDGWNSLNFCVEELQDPHKNLPRAILIGIPLVTILYVLTNISYFTVLSPQALLASPAVAVSWAELAFPQFAWTIPIFVGLSTFGAANGMLFTSGRLVFVTAREKDMISMLSYVNVNRATPTTAIMFTTFIGILLMIPASIGALIDLFGFASWIFYGIVFSALIYLRFKLPNAHRPYKVPIGLPITAMLVSVYLVLAPIIDNPKVEYFYAIMFILAGLFFYFPFVHFKKEVPGMDYINMFVQLLMQVAPPPMYVASINPDEEEDKKSVDELQMDDVAAEKDGEDNTSQREEEAKAEKQE